MAATHPPTVNVSREPRAASREPRAPPCSRALRASAAAVWLAGWLASWSRAAFAARGALRRIDARPRRGASFSHATLPSFHALPRRAAHADQGLRRRQERELVSVLPMRTVRVSASPSSPRSRRRRATDSRHHTDRLLNVNGQQAAGSRHRAGQHHGLVLNMHPDNTGLAAGGEQRTNAAFLIPHPA